MALIEPCEIPRDHPYLRRILDLAGTRLVGYQRRVDFRQDDATAVAALGKRTQTRLERPDSGVGGKRGIITQPTNDRDTGQRLAADRADAKQLPTRLRTAHASFHQPLFG